MGLKAVSRSQGANRDIKSGGIRPHGFELEFEEWPVLVKAGSGLPDEQPVSVLGTPEFMQEHGWRFVAQHIVVEIGITTGILITYAQMAPVLGDKARKA